MNDWDWLTIRGTSTQCSVKEITYKTVKYIKNRVYVLFPFLFILKFIILCTSQRSKLKKKRCAA